MDGVLTVDSTFEVHRIPSKVGKAFVIEHHYSHGIHNGPMTWGLFRNDTLVGVCAFATPASENVRASVFGEDMKQHVTELHRLVLLDDTPRNSESFFISRALAGLKAERPWYFAALSFADETEGHIGTIYQATNALYLGRTGRARFWRDRDGRLRHPRQNGVNIDPAEAKDRGWRSEMREAKHRYLFLMPNNKRHKKELLARLRRTPEQYPKRTPQ